MQEQIAATKYMQANIILVMVLDSSSVYPNEINRVSNQR